MVADIQINFTWQCPHSDRMTVDTHISLFIDCSYCNGVVGGGSEPTQFSLCS